MAYLPEMPEIVTKAKLERIAMKKVQYAVAITLFLMVYAAMAHAAEPTYAERLGWPADAKVVIFHVDDAGMSYPANLGTIKAMEEGLATSCSIMMPCSWVSGYVQHLKDHPDTDAGLHLTLTSEWLPYRWGPLAGKSQVPGLVDAEGCLWKSVSQVVTNATPDEVETEIRAQIERADSMGIKYTHLDSHMGTLFATPEFLERYVKVGIEKQVPILLPGGHMQYISQEDDLPVEMVRLIAKKVWDAGLPGIDDALAETYSWRGTDKTDRFIDALRNMKPGILEIIVHPVVPTEEFAVFSGSTETRKADLDAMLDPRLKQFIEDEGIILTTWRELKERRDRIAAQKE